MASCSQAGRGQVAVLCPGRASEDIKQEPAGTNGAGPDGPEAVLTPFGGIVAADRWVSVLEKVAAVPSEWLAEAGGGSTKSRPPCGAASHRSTR